jgi:hypothetical protein
VSTLVADRPLPTDDRDDALTPEDVAAEDVTPEDVTPEDDAAQAEVIALLASVDYLRPDAALSDTPMPDHVWARLHSVIAHEAATPSETGNQSETGTSAGGVATVTPIRRSTRWASGLVAASVAIVAVGIGVGVLRQDPSESVTATAVATAGTAPAADAAASPEAATAVAAPSAPETDKNSAADPVDTVTPEPPASAAAVDDPPATVELRATGEPPARVVLASSTDYTPADLPGQVSSLFASMGVETADEAMSMPVTPVTLPVADGFTASWQALVVDRARFLGSDAGVVVAPGDAGPALGESTDANPQSPAPTLTVDAVVGSLDVWVVDPECTKSVGSIRDYLDYRWLE